MRENIVLDVIQQNNLTWTFESMEYIERKKMQPIESIKQFSIENIILIIKAGLSSNDRETNKAYDILDSLRVHGVSPRLVHVYLIEYLTREHFFSDTEDILELSSIYQNMIESIIASQHLISEIFTREQYIEDLENTVLNTTGQDNTGSNI